MNRFILLTGFRSFGLYRENSSEQVARALSSKKLSGYQIEPFLFSASIPGIAKRGEEMFEQAMSHGYRAIISLGMASECRGIRIETIATNRIDSEKYCPEISGTPVDCTRGYRDELQINLRPWEVDEFYLQCWKQSIPVEFSHDAGGFCCNHLAYECALAQLKRIRNENTVPFIFLHVPCCPEAVEGLEGFAESGKVIMDTKTIIRGLEILLSGADL
ncbi:MAG: hypothetical protein Q7S34_01640 [bacterium]|nr:hypothetical protein [bacterium]